MGAIWVVRGFMSDMQHTAILDMVRAPICT